MSEIEPPVINKELTDQKPFVIRGHHLGYYATLIKDVPYKERVPNPAEEARVIRRMMEALPSTTFILKPDDSWENKIPSLLAYSQDVIGTSKESADRYEQRIRETFERFISLPNDYPAELIEEMPDAMCEACAVGEHCRSLSVFSKIPGADMGARESEYLDEFLENIRLLNLPNPVISCEQTHFSDSEKEEVRRIKTTIGVVRKVLKET